MLNFLLLLALSAAAAAPARRLDPHHQSGDLLDPHHHSGRHDSELEYMEMDMGCGPGGKVADFLPATPMAICIGGVSSPSSVAVCVWWHSFAVAIIAPPLVAHTTLARHCLAGNQPLYKTADDAMSDSGASSAHVMTFGEYDLYMPSARAPPA